MLFHTFRSMLGAAVLLVAAQATHATTAPCSSCNEGQMQAKAKLLGAGGSPHCVESGKRRGPPLPRLLRFRAERDRW